MRVPEPHAGFPCQLTAEREVSHAQATLLLIGTPVLSLQGRMLTQSLVGGLTARAGLPSPCLGPRTSAAPLLAVAEASRSILDGPWDSSNSTLWHSPLTPTSFYCSLPAS